MTNTQLLNIKEVAKQTGLTSRTIRFYEELGLISSMRNCKHGLRCYQPSVLSKIQRIRELQELLGFSLEEIKLFINVNCICRRQKYHSLNNIKEKIQMLKEDITTLTNLRDLAQKRANSLKLLIDDLEEGLAFLKQELKSQNEKQKISSKVSVNFH